MIFIMDIRRTEPENMGDIEEILAQMSLKEKIALCSGKNFWQTKSLKKYGIPALFMSDGPHGLRKQELKADMLGVHNSVPATCFPAAVTTGASWDTNLMERIGEAVGEEARACGVGLVLGPGANIKRNPLCGRNFEYISEDPFLAGKMAAGMIRGLQKNGVSASLKHFACNNQELLRFISDSVIDERTLREIYLTAFEIAVKEARPATVMCAYNKINGVHCSDSHELLTGILREEWGFEGLVVTDWSAMYDRIEGFKAGCDLSMPGGSAYMEGAVLEAVRSGSISESDVDRCAGRVLSLMKKAAGALKDKGSFEKEDHHALAREAAESGAVLLKNDGILPFREETEVVLVGARKKGFRYQGSGSSHINPFRVVSPVEAMPGCVYVAGCNDHGETTEEMLKKTAEAAGKAEAAVVFAGLADAHESEGYDRENMRMPEGHVRMIEAVAAANPNTVVVLCCGCAVECPWADLPSVRAILYMGLGGQAMGEAVYNLLYGRANPSGRLTESWPLRYEDCVSSGYYDGRDARYQEGVYVGYRYYEKAGVPVRWPFGFGLSYTSFAYSELRAEENRVTVTVTNTGQRAGAEVVQLYIAPPEGAVYRPARELKGFGKVFLNPGESETLTFPLTERSFAVWQDGWRVPGGVYRVQVGGLTAEVSVAGERVEIAGGSWYVHPQGEPPQEEWENLLGRGYTEPKAACRGEFTMESSIVDMRRSSLFMRFLYKAAEMVIARGFPKEERNMRNPAYKMLMLSGIGGPIRSIQISSGIRGGLFRGLVEIANGHYLKGIREMLRLKS